MGELEARVAQTVVGPDSVLTSPVSTWVPLTLINIHAHGLVLRRLEAVVADALVTSLQINTQPMTANIRNLQTLIAIYTGPVGGELEARRTLAAVAAWAVDAVRVALAQVVTIAALIDVFTDQEQVVVTEACRAFTAETADLVNAHTVCTDARNLFTLVNVNSFSCVNVKGESGNISTYSFKVSCPRRRAWLTRFVPGLADVVRAAAHPLCHIKRQLVFTSGPVVASVAKAFPHVHAVVSSVDLHVLGRANASVIPQSVVAGSRSAHAGMGEALINIFTDAGFFTEVVTLWTLTLEAPESVDTVSTLAEPW